MSWALASFLLLAVAVAVGLAWYERERPPSRVLALVAALAALAVVGRLAFAAIPNVKPTTDIVLFGGYALGAAPGFAVGAVAALVSNIFLCAGPVDGLADGGVGRGGRAGRRDGARCFGAASPSRLLAGRGVRRWPDWPSAPGWTCTSGPSRRARTSTPTWPSPATSLPYNLAHAIGNVGFCAADRAGLRAGAAALPPAVRGALAGAGRRGAPPACWPWWPCWPCPPQAAGGVARGSWPRATCEGPEP